MVWRGGRERGESKECRGDVRSSRKNPRGASNNRLGKTKEGQGFEPSIAKKGGFSQKADLKAGSSE